MTASGTTTGLGRHRVGPLAVRYRPRALGIGRVSAPAGGVVEALPAGSLEGIVSFKFLRLLVILLAAAVAVLVAACMWRSL